MTTFGLRNNGLDQALDILGSLTQLQTASLGNEPLGAGAVNLFSGADGVITFTTPNATLTSTILASNAAVGQFVTISGDSNSGNNGTFFITAIGTNSVTYVNTNAVAVASGVAWAITNGYTLEDDMNFVRTDRKAIKGTTNWFDPIPTYTDAKGATQTASLNHFASSSVTTDRNPVIISQLQRGVTAGTGTTVEVTAGSGTPYVPVSATNSTGIPLFDNSATSALGYGNRESCYVIITDPATENEIVDPSTGKLIFGLTVTPTVTDGTKLKVAFYSVAVGTDLSTATAYTWGAPLPATIDMAFPQSYTLNEVPPMAFRRILTLGMMTDAGLRLDINNITSAVGLPASGVNGGFITDLSTVLTNTTAAYAFSHLGTATPSVVNALNTLNSVTGDLTFSGIALSPSAGTTAYASVAAAIQALASFVANSAFVRYIEVIATEVAAGASHLLPNSMTYTLDVSGMGGYLWVFRRGLLMDPGALSSGFDYQEVDTTHIKFYSKCKVGDRINYFKR